MVSPIRSSVSLPVYATPPLPSFHRITPVDSAMSDPVVNLESKVGELRAALLSLQQTSTTSFITMEALSTRVAQLTASLDRKLGDVAHTVLDKFPHSGGPVQAAPLHQHLAQHRDGESSGSDACAEALFWLRQTGSLAEYIAEFHRLASRASTVSSDLLLSSFLWGLRGDIRYDLRKHKPETTEEAIALAVEFEQRQLTHQCAASDSEDLIGIDSPPPIVLDPLGGVDNIHFAATQCPVKAARQMFDELPKPTRDFNLDFSIGYHPKIADKGGGCVDLVVFSNGIGHHKELSGVHSDSTTALARGTYISAHKAVEEIQSHPTCDPAALSPLDVVAPISFVSPTCTAQFAHNVFAKMPDSSRVRSHRKIDDQDGEFMPTDDCWVDAKETAAPNLADKKFEVDFPSLEKFVQELKCAVESECTAGNRKEHALQLGAGMVNCVIVVDLEHLGVRDKGGGHMGSLYSAAHSNIARLYVDNKIRGKAFQGRSDRISDVYLGFQATSVVSAYQRGIIDKGGTPSQYNLPMHKSDGYVSKCLNWDMQTEYEMTLNENDEVEEVSNASAFVPKTKLNFVPVDMWGPYVSGESLNVWNEKAISNSLLHERYNQSASKMDIILVQWYPGHANWLIGHGVDISLFSSISILDVTQFFTITDQEAITWGTSGFGFELVHCLILIFKPWRNCCITNLEVAYLRGIIDKGGGTPSMTLEIPILFSSILQQHKLAEEVQHDLFEPPVNVCSLFAGNQLVILLLEYHLELLNKLSQDGKYQQAMVIAIECRRLVKLEEAITKSDNVQGLLEIEQGTTVKLLEELKLASLHKDGMSSISSSSDWVVAKQAIFLYYHWTRADFTAVAGVSVEATNPSHISSKTHGDGKPKGACTVNIQNRNDDQFGLAMEKENSQNWVKRSALSAAAKLEGSLLDEYIRWLAFECYWEANCSEPKHRTEREFVVGRWLASSAALLTKSPNFKF